MFEFWYTLLILIALSVILIKEWMETEIAIFGSVILLILGEVITIKEAFSGFSNAGMLTIALLFIIAGSIYNTGALSRFNDLMFGKNPRSGKRTLFRMIFPISAISAFLNNTPVVAMYIPLLRSWTEKHNLSLSKYLIPLSYAAILGGMCTLIGTSTNLIIHGLLLEHGLPGLGLFEISKIGVPIAIIGLLYITFIGYPLLPDRKEPMMSLDENTREFVIALKVENNYPHISQTIEEAGLRHLKGLFLFQIERKGEILAPAKPDEKILEDDRLFFTGLPRTILELQKTPGLRLMKDAQFNLKQYDSSRLTTYEAVISPTSPLVGQNVRESNFRGKYDAVIIAIHRNGERINKKIGDIVISPGDTLLLLADTSFQQKWYHSSDFYLISTTVAVPSKEKWQIYLSLGVLGLMIGLTLFNIVSLVAAASIAALILIFTRCITPGEARRLIDFRVLIIIASAFGLARAIENSGLAKVLAESLLSLGGEFGIIGILATLYFATSFYTMIITSNATAPLLFPVAFTAAMTLNMDAKPFVLTILIAAAASFASPISYQTNLMVYGPGGYKFTDFLKVGLPLQALAGIVAISLIYFFYF
jgi:di/tricarboxylate transporter